MSRNKSEDSALKKEIVSIGKHSSIYVVGQALSRAVGFFMIPIYTRYIAPTNYGAMEMIEILSSILLFTISVGASEGLSRYYYSDKDEARRKEIVSTAIIGFSIISIPIVFLFWLGAGALSNLVLEEKTYRYILQVSLITMWFSMFCDIGFTYLRMVYRAKLFVSLTTVQLIMALSLNIWFVVYLKLNIMGIFYSTLISQATIGSILIFGILRKVGIRFSSPKLLEMIKFSIPLVPSRIGLMLGFVSNRFFLRWLGPADPATALAQIGLFSLGHKFGVIVNRFINAPFNSFWSPRRMELLLASEGDSRETVARVCTYATFLSIFCGLVISASIASVIDIMADPSYKGAHVVVPFVVLSYIALGLESHFTAGILISKNTKWMTYITVLSLVVIVAWNFIFVPRYGLIGAASSNLAGFTIRLVFGYFIAQRFYPIPYELGRLAILLSVAMALYFASQMISLHSPYANFIARTAFVGTFPLILYGSGFFHKGERQFIQETIRKGGNAMKIMVQGIVIR
jgi:O-antigen/teichoic acid export membrane protein